MAETTDYRAINKQLKNEFDFRVIGKHMQSIRKSRGMTQAEVAEKMKLGTKYYASIEAGAVKISFQRFLQFVVLMQASSDYLLSGCHPEYQTLFSCKGDVCKERLVLNGLLDQCSDELIKTLCVITQSLMSTKDE